MRGEDEDSRTLISRLPLHLNILEHVRIIVASIVDSVKQSQNVFTYVQNSATFHDNAGRNRFEAEKLGEDH